MAVSLFLSYKLIVLEVWIANECIYNNKISMRLHACNFLPHALGPSIVTSGGRVPPSKSLVARQYEGGVSGGGLVPFAILLTTVGK
jgi:hypothetical protein